MITVQACNKGIRIACFVGFSLAYYSYIVETNVEHDPNYVAMCDINEYMSCTKAFNSKYGKGFGVVGKLFGEESLLNQPNSIPGMFFYIICFLMSLRRSLTASKTLLILSVISNFMSIYLAYILYFILHDFCVVCVSTYIVNFLLLLLSHSRHQQIISFKKNE